MSLLEVASFFGFALAGAIGASTARSSDGLPISFDVSGTGNPTLVLVHGWAFDRHLWDNEVKRLSSRYRVVTLDLAGHGESGRQRAKWTMGAFGEDVKAVVEAANAKDVVLVGHSMGGAVVVEAARRMPERVKGIVLIDTLLDVEQRTPAEAIESMAKQLAADYPGTVTKMTTEYLFAPATPVPVKERVLRHTTAIPADTSIAMLRESWTYDPVPALRDIKVPVRAVNSDKFPTNLDVNRRHMPGFAAFIVAGTGHYPMLEDPKRFSAGLDEALAQVLKAKP
jgi:sigma-B regulation protein RsbQ